MSAGFLFTTFQPKNNDPKFDRAHDALNEHAGENTTIMDCYEGERDVVDVRAAIDEVRDTWESMGRYDTALFQVRDQKLLLTGGMTHGDEPTEFFATLNLLEITGVLGVMEGHAERLED